MYTLQIELLKNRILNRVILLLQEHIGWCQILVIVSKHPFTPLMCKGALCNLKDVFSSFLLNFLCSSSPQPVTLTAVSHMVTATVISTVETKDTKMKIR